MNLRGWENIFQASAGVVSKEEHKRNKRQYDQPYIAAQGQPGRPVLASPGGLINGLITNLLNNAAYTGRQVATTITGSLAGILQSLGQAGSDAHSTLVGNPHPGIVYGYDFYPHPRPEQIGNPRPPPNPSAGQPEKRTIRSILA